MKKGNAISLILLLIISTNAIFAASYKGFHYEVNARKEVTIHAYYGKATDLQIPETIDGNKVTAIGEYAFAGNSTLTSVTIPSSVIFIGFLSYSSKRIFGVSVLTGLSAKGGGYTFYQCANLKAINVAEDNPIYTSEDGILFDKDKTMLIKYPGAKVGAYVIPESVVSIESAAFDSCVGLTQITVPNTIKIINESTFRNCTNLTSIDLPESIKSIGYAAFEGCSSLRAITIPKNVTSIPGYAFKNCSSLTSITLPDNTDIGHDAFSGCTSLTSIDIPGSWVGSNAFDGCTSLTSIDISGNWVCSNAFRGCSSLVSITIPNTIKLDGGSSFTECPSLQEINIAENNPKYASENGVLFNKDKTTLLAYPGGKTGEYVIPSSVTSIARSAFDGCLNLTAITIPDSVNSIGSYTFAGCLKLTSVNIPASVTNLSSNVFYNCDNLRSISVDENNAEYASVDGVLFNKEKTMLLEYPGGKKGHYAIPNHVAVIGSSAFVGNKGLTSVDISKNMTEIPYNAFSGCSNLVTVNIPDSVKMIGGRTFYGCTNLTEIVIPESVTRIGYANFVYCTALTSVTIPSSVTSIGEDNFVGSNNVTIFTTQGSYADSFAQGNEIDVAYL